MKLSQELLAIAQAAKEASSCGAILSSELKDKALREMACALISAKSFILKENKKDLKAASAAKLSKPFIDRLTLNEKRLAAMADSLIEIANLPDPVNEVIKAWRRPNGLWIHKVRVPIGVIAIIYESRPNVTSDCIGLCFKSGNSVILRGGSESLYSNQAIYVTLKEVLKKYQGASAMVQMVATDNRKAIDALLQLKDHIDLVMPRGGEGLIKKVSETSRIPVIKHYKGICHVFVDNWANVEMARKICLNAKVQRPGVCNAMETMLVHRDIAVRFLPGMLEDFRKAGVEVRGCSLTQKLGKNIKAATDKDFHTEYLDMILSVKVVESLQDAISHINAYGSRHSDSIVTENYDHALEFLRKVDSACVYVNASTRFTDGCQFGMGAEIGISTDKLHARGPMALEELTTYKYMVFGNGQVRT